MTTITIDAPVKLPKTHFKDLSELFLQLKPFVEALEKEAPESFSDLDFRELEDHEITPEILASVAATKKEYQTNPKSFSDL